MIHAFLGVLPVYDSTNFIAPSADVIGDVTLGRGASVWFNATVRGDVNWIRIGEATNVQDNAVIHVTNRVAPTEIGARVTVGHSAIVHGCTVEDNVLVGMGAILLDHAVVGTESIVGAGALVTGGTRIPPRSLVLGKPARVVRSLSEEEVDGIAQYAANYLKYSALYRGEEVPEENPFYQPAPRR
jgi:carbonic anhydrase/acetyltransferase-like protein (isoleucine patch superfamily)